MKLFAVALILFAYGANAECPNACSGHGRCNNYAQVFLNSDVSGSAYDAYVGSTPLVSDDSGNCPDHYLGYLSSVVVKDSCTCYARREGEQVDSTSAVTSNSAQLVFAWTGYDCSLRTCPLGISWDGGQGNLLKTNDHSFKEECSGKGVCDRKTGQCACFDGYEGEGCRRSSCPNQCNGHGICQSQATFARDADMGRAGQTESTRLAFESEQGSYADGGDTEKVHVKYDLAWDHDKTMGCKCDAGYRGADCSQLECLSGDDPMLGEGALRGRDCSGRGICNYEEGLCECFAGYRGARCENQNVFA